MGQSSVAEESSIYGRGFRTGDFSVRKTSVRKSLPCTEESTESLPHGRLFLAEESSVWKPLGLRVSFLELRIHD